jgi:hypothetical protein
MNLAPIRVEQSGRDSGTELREKGRQAPVNSLAARRETLRALDGRRGHLSFRLPRLMNGKLHRGRLLAVARRDSVERPGAMPLLLKATIQAPTTSGKGERRWDS